jgi:hypothetical protein
LSDPFQGRDRKLEFGEINMKNRLISDEKIDEFINKLSESVFDSKVETEDKNLISWELFFR